MIESNIVKWLDFGDSTQSLDVYTKKGILLFFKFFKALIKYKYFPIAMNIFFMIIFFIQIWTMNIISVSSKGDVILEILDYLKKVIIFHEIITNEMTYKKIFIIIVCIVFLDVILIIFTVLTMKKVNMPLFFVTINYLNLLIYFYFNGSIISFFLINTRCENGSHVYLGYSCYSGMHLIYFIFSIIILLLSVILSFIYSFYCNEIDLITTNINSCNARIDCNYEVFCLVSKIIIFFIGFYVRIYNKELLKLIYEIIIFFNSLIMSIYIYKNVYYYNDIINYLNFFGWVFSSWFSFNVLLKTIFHLECITNLIIVGWLIIVISFYKALKMTEYALITSYNIFEFKTIKSIEMYKNILINKMSNKNSDSKILLFGIIKKFEEFTHNNPEINVNYHKLLNNNLLSKQYNQEDELPILSILYILYSFYLDKTLDKEEITLHMSYYLINILKNPSYSMLLCSKLKSKSHKFLYYKYLLIEDIKQYLIFQLNKNSNKETIRHVEIGKVILYNLYMSLFKIKIYDAICNQIDYFDLLKNNIYNNKTTENFLKTGETILNTRKEILIIWEKIIQLNPFSDECQKDYILYLDSIIQDENFSREESKKYLLLKNSKFNEKDNIYHSMFLLDSSCVLLVDGYLTNGKILYATQNFSYLFMYNYKELLNITIDDLLPNGIQTFHKELIDDAIKYSNISHIFKKPRNSFIKSKNGGLININLFVKPVPNLNYGLVFYTYIQKVNDSKLFFIIDKDLRISGFTEMPQFSSSFTINNGLNLTQNIIGYHIGLFIPDILALLQYKNDEFNITKQNYELKGYLYPLQKLKEYKNKLDIILAKIKSNKTNGNNNHSEIDMNDINSKIKEMLRKLNNEKIRPFSIFYKIQLINFLNGKYKYYRIDINFDILSNNDNEGIANQILTQNQKRINYKEFKSSISIKSKNKKKIIKQFKDKNSKIDDNDNEKSSLTLNGKKNNNIINHQQNDLEDKDKSDNNIININKGKQQIYNVESLSSYDSNPYNMNAFNKLKNEIINQKETYPLKIMIYLGLLFTIMSIIFMIFDFYQNKVALINLDNFLNDNLFFNCTKIISAGLYINGVNIRWLSHSLFLNSQSCIVGDHISFYKGLLIQNIDFLDNAKKEISTLGQFFQKIASKKNKIEMNVYKFDYAEEYNFNLDNIITFLMNTGIKIIDSYSDFYPDNCKNISKELSLGEVNLKNMIEISYYFYNSDIKGYTGKEKNKLIGKIINRFPLAFLIFGVISVIIFLFFAKYSFSLLNIEIYFLEKLINFNSPNFDSYLKKIDEIKKKLRNETSEDEDKGDDMDFNEIDSKKKDEEEGNEILIAKKKFTEKENKTKKKLKAGKQSKIIMQRKKKLKIMKSYFSRTNLFFSLKIILFMIFSILYYIISIILRSTNKINYVNFDKIVDSIFSVYKDSFDILLKLKYQLEIYETNLINCTTIGEFEGMRLPKVSDLTSPTLGNVLLQISDNSGLQKSTLKEFMQLFNENSCLVLSINSDEYRLCENFWAGVLLRGIEQALIHMGVIFSNALDELQIINDAKNGKTLYNLMNQSSYAEYEHFIDLYLLRAFNKTKYIIKDLRIQKLSSIINKIKSLLIIYIIVTFFILLLFIFNVFSLKNIFNSFLNFICILPVKYISEDEKFFQEIIRFWKNYY